MKSEDVPRRVEAAQSVLATPAAELATRMERALGDCYRNLASAIARLEPETNASTLDVAGGIAIQAGPVRRVTRALAMGFGAPVSQEDVERVEAHIAPGGRGVRRVELCPFVDPTLPRLLGARRYAVHEWHVVWTRAIPGGPLDAHVPADAALRVRRAHAGEEDLACRLILAGSMESDTAPDAIVALMRPQAFAPNAELYLALIGDRPAGAGILAWSDGIAFLTGSAVLPALRRRGAQSALLRARLERAGELGCAYAYTATLPGTTSMANIARHGFQMTYPKTVMQADAASPV